MGLRGSPLSFWIPVLVLFPGGTQRWEGSGPGAAVGACIGGRARGVTARALLVGGVHLLDFGSVGAVGGNAIGLVQRQWWVRVRGSGIVGLRTVGGFIGIVGWVGAVDRHSSPPSVGTQFRIRLTLGNGSGPDPVQLPREYVGRGATLALRL